MAKNQWGDEPAVAEDPRTWGDKPAAQRDLPADVAPSTAGAGRGSVNPDPVEPGVPVQSGPVDTSDPMLRVAPSAGATNPTFTVSDELPKSVLRGQTLPELPFNPVEGARLSDRGYAERTPLPGDPRRTAPIVSEGRPARRAMEDQGRLAGDGPLPVRMARKASAGAAEGAYGVLRAGAEAVGADDVARFAKESTGAAREFQEGMGQAKPVAGFGPNSPVPYLTDMAEGAGSSLLSSGVMAATFGPGAVIPLMSIQSAGQQYDRAREAGQDPAAALANALPYGVFEAVGEKFQGLDKAASALGVLMNQGSSAMAKRTAADVLVRSGVREIPGEVLTYLGQTGVDLLPGIGINQNLTMSQFLDGLRDTVVQSAMMGAPQVLGGRAAQPAPRRQPGAEEIARTKGFLVDEKGKIERLRAAGETEAAAVLQRRLDVKAADGELEALRGQPFHSPAFEQQYRTLRASGVKPAEASAKAAMLGGFAQMGGQVGLPAKAVTRASEEAAKLPLDKVPGFLDRFMAMLTGKGLGTPVPEGAVAGALEAAGDQAMGAAIDTVYAQQAEGAVDRIGELVGAAAPAAPATEMAAEAFDAGNDVLVTPEADSVHQAATSPLNGLPEPTEAQKAAGNYKVGRLRVAGLDISVENPQGSVRRGTDAEGKAWESPMRSAHYGYIRQTEGKDGDKLDVFVKPGTPEDFAGPVFVVDQIDPKTGKLDEHKVVLGAADQAEAEAIYRSAYDANWQGLGAITQLPLPAFKAWAQSGKLKEPLGDISQARPQAAAEAAAAAGDLPAVRADEQPDAVASGADGQAGADAAADAQPALRALQAAPSSTAAPVPRAAAPAPAAINSGEMADSGSTPESGTPGTAAPVESLGATGTRSKAGDRARSRAYEANPFKAFLGKHGLASDLASEFAPGATERRAALVPGYGPVFRKSGKQIDDLAQAAVEEGFLTEPDVPALEAMIDRALRGERIIPQFAEGAAENEMQAMIDRQRELEEDAAEDLGALSDLELDVVEDVLDDVPGLDAQSNVSLESAMRAMGFTEQEISDAIAEKPAVAQADRQGGGQPEQAAAVQEAGTAGSREGQARSQVAPEPTQTPADAGVSVSGPEFVRNGSGTLTVRGDPAALIKLLADNGITRVMRAKTGVLVGKTEADKAERFLAKRRKAPKAAPKPQAGKPLSVGMTPSSAEPVTVKDGVVYVGKSEALDFDSGEPITVPAGASDAQIKKALQDGGAISRRQHFYGGEEGAKSGTAAIPSNPGELESPTKDDVLEQQRRREAGEKAEAKAKQEREAKAKADAERGEFKLSGSDRAADANPDQGAMFARGADDPFAISDTRQRRKAVLAVLGEGWTAQNGIEGSRDLFKRREGTLSVSLMRQRSVDGNFYVGSYDVKTKRGSNTSEPKTLDEAKAEAERLLGIEPMSARGAKPIQSAAIFVGGKVVTAATHGAAINHAIKEGLLTRDADGGLNLGADDSIDLFLTGDGRVVDRLEADQEFGVSSAEQAQEKGLIKITREPKAWTIGELRQAIRQEDAAFARSSATEQRDGSKKDILMARNASMTDEEVAAVMRLLAVQRGGLPTEKAQKIVDGLTAKWKNGPKVTVVATHRELPVKAPADARGLYYKGQVWVVAAAHRDGPQVRKTVARTLAHEAISHYGLRELLGRDGWARLMRQINAAIAAGNKPLKEIQAEIRRLYVDEDGNFNLSPAIEADEIAARVVEEAIDASGEFRPGFGFVKAVYAKIAEFLRGLGIDVAFTNAELHGMLVLAQRNLEVGKRTAGGGEVLVAAAREPGQMLRAFHGSPHEFDAFDMGKVGTGEGAQAYGWGLYFAGKREVAEFYRDKLSREHRGDTATWTFGGKRTTLNEFIQAAPQRHSELGKRDAENAAFLASEFVSGNRSTTKEMLTETALGKAIQRDMDGLKRTTGKLYEVEIPDEGAYLLWDKTLDEQPEAVQKALRAMPENLREIALRPSGEMRAGLKGEDFYRAVSEALATPVDDLKDGGWTTVASTINDRSANDRAASEALHRAGLSGIKYLDGASRHRTLREVKREFLAELPEDAGFDEVLDLVGTGTFSPGNEAIIKALAADDWLGFDYPAQALSAALGGQLGNFDASPALVKAVEAAQDGSTYNYVVFNDQVVKIEAMFSRVNRRSFLIGTAAALADPATAATTLGKARPVPAAVLNQRLPTTVEKLLVGQRHGVTNLDGAKALREALQIIATTGPQELRALASEISNLMPEKGVALQVDKGDWTAHGAVEIEPMVRLRLFDGKASQGMDYDTFLHESLHVAVAARYRSLSVGVVRENDAKLAMPAPAASAALAQFRAVYDEFRAMAYPVLRDLPKDSDLRLTLEEARSTPDEFFVRALTEPRLQAWMAQQEYQGKTLWERFKEWVKKGLTIFHKPTGTQASWLDAALAASDDVLKAMSGDKPDFARLRAISQFNSRASDRRSALDSPDVLASRADDQGGQFARGAAAAQPAPVVNQQTSPWRDPSGRLQFAPGAWLFDRMGKLSGPLLAKVGMKPMSKELKRQMREMKLAVQKAQETAAAVAGEAMKLSEDERGMVSDLIEQELAAGTVPPAHAVRLAAMINDSMGAQTDELVRLGMLSKDSADLWRGKYLPRFYKNKLTRQVGDAWADALRQLRGKQKVMAGIKGKHLKGRGLYETVPASAVADWEALGWEVRDPDHPAGDASEISLKILSGQIAPEDTVQVWRDFTRAERDKMGEIRDAGFRFVMGYMQTQRDIALGRMFEGLAGSPEMSSKRQSDTFTVQVPDGTVPGTGAKRYGKLAGRWVSRETMSHLSQIEESQSEAWRMYRKALALWKESKTALNPVSHVNNTVSNITMAHFAGVSYWQADKYIAAARDFATKAPAIQQAKDAGLFLGTMSDAELMNTLPAELKALVQQQDSAAAKIGRTAFNVMTFWLRKPMGWAYQAEDTFFRYLLWKDATDRGLDPKDAVDWAQKFIFAYDDLPKGARMVRDFGIPFFSYTYKAAPALLETALTHPLRFAAPAAVLWGINAAAYAIAAGDDDDEWMDSLARYLTDPAFRAKVREDEQLERENLPPWLKGKTALLTPKVIRLGMDEVTKLPLFIDTARIVPGGDLFDVSPNAGGIPLPQPITPSHPLFTTAVAMLANKDMFFGKELVDSNDTRAEAAAKRADWLWKQFTPAVAVGNYHFERGMNALAQATGEPVRWLPEAVSDNAEVTGIGRDGLPVQPKYAAMQTFGIKVRPFDLERSAEIGESLKAKMIREIDAEMRSLRRLNAMGAVSDSVYEKAADKADEKKDRIREGLTVDGEPRN